MPLIFTSILSSVSWCRREGKTERRAGFNANRDGAETAGCSMIGQLAHRILLVGDEPHVRKLLSTILLSAGYVVRTAVDGIDGIAKLRGSPIDLIISDLELPRMSGREFLAIVRQRFPKIPVIALDREAGTEDAPAGLPVDVYFRKGVSAFADILEFVASLIQNPPPRDLVPGPRNQLRSPTRDNEGHFRLTCGDCLRSFEAVDGLRSWRGKQASTCPICGGVVWFPTAAADVH